MRQKLALIFFISIAVSAFADPYTTKISGDISSIIDTANMLRDDSREPVKGAISSNSTSRLSFVIDGLGRFNGVIYSPSSRDWDAYFVNSKGEKSFDTKDVILFKGSGKLNKKNIKISGSFYKHRDKPYIHLLLNGGRITKRSYYIAAPISSGSKLQAKVKALPEFITKTLSCGQKDKHIVNDNEHSLKVSSSIGTRSIKVTKIATDADPEYYDTYKGDTNAHIATLLNDASDIYQSQLGFGLRPATQHVFTESVGNPYTSTNANTLLDQFKSYTLTNSHLGSANGYHMFSGKEWDGSTVGLAYVGVICQYEEYSFGITQKFHESSDSAILAHELGHNFGAQHDSSSGSSIMAPYITIPGATSFSSTSIGQIQSHLASAPDCMSLVDDDGGSGGNGAVPPPSAPPTTPTSNPTIEIKASVNGVGLLKITTTVESIPEASCKETLYASDSSTDKGRKFYSFSPTRKTTALTVKGLKATRQGVLYLTAQYSCYSELDPSISTQVTVNLKKIRKKTSLSTRSLIGALVRSFRD